MSYPRTILLVVVILTLASPRLSAQLFQEDNTLKYDTSYISVYKDELTTRLFLSRKQNGFNLSERLLSPWIKYRTNDNLLLGLGYTYSFLTLNLAVKFPFINVDDDRYGESRYLDLQSHTYFRDVIVDFYLQWNKGFYMANPENVYPGYQRGQEYPIRGDLRTNILGLNLQYLFNSEKYSYKAAFVQNEFQRKSAGSPMAGLEAHWVMGMSDSALVAGDIPEVGFLDNNEFNQCDVINLGINGGYAYTFVWQETLYLSLSTSFGVSAGQNLIHNSMNSETISSRLTLGLTNSTRISLGYNTSNYYVGLSYIRFGMVNQVGDNSNWIGYNTSNIRVNFVKRFITKRSIKLLRPDLWIL